MRKLCTDEVEGVKTKKNAFYNSKKRIFFVALFGLAPLALHFRDDL
jgi:hypothetical protein